MKVLDRRGCLISLGVASSGLLLPRRLLALEAPDDDAASGFGLPWTASLRWNNVVDITSIAGDGKYWDRRLEKAQDQVVKDGGGVVYFPPGEYSFDDHIQLRDGVILRGAMPQGETSAHSDSFTLESRIEFPKYEPSFSGSGTPIETAFKGIHLADRAKAANCGVVHLAINNGHIHLKEDENHNCGANRIVVGCILRNCAVADSRVPSNSIGQKAWQRFTHRHHAAIHVDASENILVAGNRLPKSGEANFTMKNFVLKANRKSKNIYDVVFDYDNRPGMYVSEHCIGGAGGSGNDGTPETHPWGFRKGIVIRDNYLYQTGRTPIAFTGDGTLCQNNVIRVEKNVWRPTATGLAATSGSSTNDNRAIQMRGWRWTVDGNDFEVHKNWCADRSYYINDGEGLMHEDHCNSEIVDSRLTNNKGNSYLSIYKCGKIDGLVVEGNDISTPGKIADIYVVSDRNSGPQPMRNVSIIGNRTRSNGILVKGSPAKGVLVSKNEHVGGGGKIMNEAAAKLSANRGYNG